MDKNPSTLQVVIYTYVRIIEDHEGPRFKTLRQAEVDFCIQLIRERVSTYFNTRVSGNLLVEDFLKRSSSQVLFW